MNSHSTPIESGCPRLPLDIISVVFNQTDELATVFALAEAYPSLFLTPLNDRFKTLAPRMLPQWWSEDFRRYAYTAVVAEESSPAKTSVIDLPMPSKDLRLLMDNLLEDSGPPGVPESLSPSVKTMKKLVEIGEVVEFSYHLRHKLFTMKFPELARRPPSKGEALRLRRALLRFHLYAQLFHEPGAFATSNCGPEKNQGKRLAHEYYYFIHFNRVEVEEMKCICSLFLDVLKVLRNHMDVKADMPAKTSTRGLPLIQQVLTGDPISQHTASYITDFMNYGYERLERLDPCDWKPIQSPESNEVLKHIRQQPPRKRRWPPSAEHRLTNFGANPTSLSLRPRKSVDHWSRVSNERRACRSIGWCFSDESRETLMGLLGGIDSMSMFSMDMNRGFWVEET